MGRYENVAVFEDTEKLCQTNPRLIESIKKSTASQKIILERDNWIDQKKDLFEDTAKVIVSKKRTFEAAAGYKGYHVAVHNFASASNPGGGVVNGANAQEECLCRCSGLYFCLKAPAMWDGFYQPHRDAHNPIHNDDIIYTPSVTVFKSDTATPELMAEPDWFDVDIITCAAPNLRSQPSNQYNSHDGNVQVKIKDKDLLALHEKRLRRILEVALSEGCDTIILGAFGCGAFRNNPEIVALANRNVIKDYMHAFKNIEFAIYCPPQDDSNFRIFKRVLGK